MAYKLPRIEAIIQMVDNVSAVTRNVRASIESLNAPVDNLRRSFSSLSREARLDDVGKSAALLRERLGGVGDGFTTSLTRARNVLLGAGGIVGGMGVFLKTAADMADGVGDVSHRIGVATDTLQRFRYVAQLSGSSTETADKGLERFAKGLSAARAGTGEALAPLQAMGVRLTDARGRARSLEDVLFDVSDALARIPNAQDRLRVSSALFGKGNQALVTSLEQGSGALRGMFKEFQDAGGPISSKDIEAGMAYNDTLDRLKFTIASLSSTFAVQLFPVVSELLVKFQAWAVANRGTIESVGTLVATKLPEVLDSLATSFVALSRTMGPFLRVLWAVMDAVGPLQFALGALGLYIGVPFVASLAAAVPAVLGFGRALFTAGRVVLAFLPTLLPMLSALAATITGTVVPAISAMGVALFTTPVGWVVAGLAALAGAVYLVWRNWETVAGWVTTLWAGVSGALRTAFARIRSGFLVPLSEVPAGIMRQWEPIREFFAGLWGSIVDGAQTVARVLESVPLLGGLVSGGVSLLGGPAAPASAPTASPIASMVRSSSETTIRQASTLVVDFRNMPPGARVGEPTGSAPVSVSTGYAFAGGF